MNGDTCRVNLYVSGVSHPCTLAVAGNSCRTVTSHGVGRKEICVSITTGGDNYCMGCKAFQLTGYKVLCNDTAGTSVNEDNVFHFVAGIQFHSAYVHLAAQCRVCTQQQLLTSLTFCIESTRNLCTTE